MDRILKEERNYILNIVKKIRAAGCNVLLVQKSILRDAVTDLSLHYLAKAKIMVVKDVERDDIEFISRTLNCLPIANIEHFRAEKLGEADLVEDVQVGESKVGDRPVRRHVATANRLMCSGCLLSMRDTRGY